MKSNLNKLSNLYQKLGFSLFYLCLGKSALANVGGGLSKVQNVAEEVKTGLYALVGVLSAIYLIYLGLMAFTEKKSWADFGWGVVHVAAVGASVTLGAWAWGAFTS